MSCARVLVCFASFLGSPHSLFGGTSWLVTARARRTITMHSYPLEDRSAGCYSYIRKRQRAAARIFGPGSARTYNRHIARPVAGWLHCFSSNAQPTIQRTTAITWSDLQPTLLAGLLLY